MKIKKSPNLKNSQLKNRSINVCKTYKNILLEMIRNYREENQLTSDLEIEIVLAICQALRYFLIALLIACFFASI